MKRFSQLWGFVGSFVFFSKSLMAQDLSIVAGNQVCVKIGETLIREKNATIVDAGIAIMICEGVVNPQNSGIGGGFLGLVYMNKHTSMVNAREKTPQQILNRLQIEIRNSSVRAAGIPGAIRGYHLLHQKWGNLRWNELFEPTLELCKTPFKLRPSLANKELLREHQWHNFSFILYQHRLSQRVPYVYNPELCYVLGNVSKHGPDHFYTETAHGLISEFPNQFTYADFINYRAKIQPPISLMSQKKIKVVTLSYPGPDYAFTNAVHKILADHRIPLADFLTILKTYHDETRMQSFEYYQRLTNQTIQVFQQFEKAQRGSDVCIKKDLDAVCFSSSLNREFGPDYVSKTGIILNNQLNNFPMHYRNIKNLQPPSYSAITFLLYGSFPYLILGATGGSYAPFAALNTLFYNFQYLANPQEATNARRYYIENSIIATEKCTSFITCPRDKKAARRVNLKPFYNLVSGIEDSPFFDNRSAMKHAPFYYEGFKYADMVNIRS